MATLRAGIGEELAILHAAGPWTLVHAACTTWSKRRWLQMGLQTERSLKNAFCTPAKYDLDGFRHFEPRMFLLCRPFGSLLMSQQMSLMMPMRHSPALPHFSGPEILLSKKLMSALLSQFGALGCLQKLQKDHSRRT